MKGNLTTTLLHYYAIERRVDTWTTGVVECVSSLQLVEFVDPPDEVIDELFRLRVEWVEHFVEDTLSTDWFPWCDLMNELCSNRTLESHERYLRNYVTFLIFFDLLRHLRPISCCKIGVMSEDIAMEHILNINFFSHHLPQSSLATRVKDNQASAGSNFDSSLPKRLDSATLFPEILHLTLKWFHLDQNFGKACHMISDKLKLL